MDPIWLAICMPCCMPCCIAGPAARPAGRNRPPSGPGLRRAGAAMLAWAAARPACRPADSTVAWAPTCANAALRNAGAGRHRRDLPERRRRRALADAGHDDGLHRQDRLEHDVAGGLGLVGVHRAGRLIPHPDEVVELVHPDRDRVDAEEVGGLQHRVGDVVLFDLRQRWRRRHRRGVRRSPAPSPASRVSAPAAAVVRSQRTIGMVAATARSLAVPLHADVSAARLAASSSACVSSKIASASHPAAA